MPGSNKPSASTMSSPPPVSPILQVENVSKSYGPLQAVSEVSFTVKAGEICGLVGSDGAGKTTLLRMIAAMIPPTSGMIFVGGLEVVGQKSRVKELIGYMPQRFGLYQDLTVAENFDFFMDIYGVSGDQRVKRRKRYLGFSNLLPFLDRKAGDLSGGMKQKLGLACVLVHQPKVLILDEPTNGVDPISRQEFWEILAEMRHEDMTVLVSTAYLDEGEKCDRLLIMHDARILENATPREIKAQFSTLEEAMIQRITTVDKSLLEDNFAA
jgi:ABC-2 type transport system ATP-binding protein